MALRRSSLTNIHQAKTITSPFGSNHNFSFHNSALSCLSQQFKPNRRYLHPHNLFNVYQFQLGSGKHFELILFFIVY